MDFVGKREFYNIKPTDMYTTWKHGETEGQVIFDENLSILNYASPDPHDGSPANIDPERQKELEEVGRLDTDDDDDDFEPAGDMEPSDNQDDE